MPDFVNLLPGDPAPWFHQRCGDNPHFAFDTVAGRYIALCFFASAADPQARSALDAVQRARGVFDDERISFFGVSVDPRDEAERRVAPSFPGIRFFWDFDGTVSRLYGSMAVDADPSRERLAVRRFWMLLDPTLRVIASVAFTGDGSDRDQFFRLLKRLPPPQSFAGFEVPAPVIVLPNVFDPMLCRTLIGYHEDHGGADSGFMREVDGKTVGTYDRRHKSRRDCLIENEALRQETQQCIVRRISPEILKIHQFIVTRMERYLVACYAAEDGGHFRAHRDNTTKGTAHRRFAVSINLNAEFDGGEISFPEYGPRSFKPLPGGAVVFSCSLLHAVSPLTRGKRYAFLPFVYDDAAARIREANNPHLGEGVTEYEKASKTSE